MAIKLLNPEPEIIQNKKKMSKEELKKDIARCRARDAEIVTGIFTNLESPGSPLKFGYKKYPGDDFIFYHLVHGQKHRIPRGVARHININCCKVEYAHLKEGYGDTNTRAAINDGRLGTTEQMTAKRKVPRFSFQSMEYMDDDWDMKPSNLIEVEVTPVQNLVTAQ